MQKKILFIALIIMQFVVTAKAGDGTVANPYTVSEAIALGLGTTKQWVQGYIVGGRYDDFAQPWDNNYGVSIADSPSETDINNCLQVKLETANDHRVLWGLNSNAGNFGKKINAHGFRDTYGGFASFEGVDDISEATGGGEIATVENPTFSPVAGIYTQPQTITINCATAGTTIYYTVNSDTPTNASTLYTNPITLSETTTLKAIAYTASENSGVSTALFTFEISSTNASLPYVQNFTSNEGNFELQSTLGGQAWHWANFDGGSMVMSGFENDISNSNTDWLLTPTFDFSGYSELRFTFSEAINYLTSIDDLQVLISTDYAGGAPTEATWEELTITGRSTGDNWSFVTVDSVNLDGYSGEKTVTIGFKYISTEIKSSTWEISKVAVTGQERTIVEPTNHVTGFEAIASTITQTSIDLSWTENDGINLPDGYLIKSAISEIVPPVNGTDPNNDTLLTDGSGNVKVEHGTASYTFSQCSPGTTYNFAIYPYSGSGSSILYKTALAPTTTGTTLSTIENPQSLIATTISPSQINLSWTKNTASDKVLVAFYQHEEVAGSPENGVNYSINTDLIDGGKIIYLGDATSFEHHNLEANSYYYYKIWSLNANNEYSEGIVANAATLALEPTYHAINFEATLPTQNSITLNWDNQLGDNAPDGYLIVINTSENNLLIPTDFTDVTGDSDLSDGDGATKVGYSVESYTWTGLENGTAYYFSIFPYTNSGNFIDFKIENAPQATSFTLEQIASPVITPISGTYNDSVWVTINCPTTEVQIYYTTDGSAPNELSILYEEPFLITDNSLIKAIALKNISSSSISQANYIIFNSQATVQDPIITPLAGTYNDSVKISISCATANAVIRYTTDGSFPDENSVVYTQPVTLFESSIIIAVAFLNDERSNYIESDFIITPSFVEIPVIQPETSEFTESLEISISCETSEAQIYYSIDGSIPTILSTEYTGAFTINQTTTINAIAIKNGISSEITSSIFKLKEVKLPIEVSTIEELRKGLADGTIYHFKGNATVTFTMDFRSQKYIQDETAAILIDDNAGAITSEFTLGDGMTDLIGTLYDYNGLLEFIPTSDASNVTAEFEAMPQDISISELNQNFEKYESELIQLSSVKFETSGASFENGKDYTISNNEGSSIFRTHFYNIDLIGNTIPNASLDISGIALWHQNSAKIVSRSYSEISNSLGINDWEKAVTISTLNRTIYIETVDLRNTVVNIYNGMGAKVATLPHLESTNEITLTQAGFYLIEIRKDGKSKKVQKVSLF